MFWEETPKEGNGIATAYLMESKRPAIADRALRLPSNGCRGDRPTISYPMNDKARHDGRATVSNRC